MIEKKTVLILGAGASVPYGFPTASGLREEILSTIMTNTERIQKFDALGHSEQHLSELQINFWRSQQPSIDAFLESRPDFLEIGKHVIAAYLIPKEIKSNLHPEDWNLKEKRLDDHWYRYLFQRMGPTKKEFEDSLKNVSVITFNYDRSFEYYFFETLKSAYGLRDRIAAQLILEFQIVHVYGQLAFPDFLGVPEKWSRDYEPHSDPELTRKAASMINIVRAGEDEMTEEQEKAQELIKQARRICFIGCGYDLTNLSRLKNIFGLFPEQLIPELFGTGYGLEEDVRQRAERLLTVHQGGGPRGLKIAHKEMTTLQYLKSKLVLD